MHYDQHAIRQCAGFTLVELLVVISIIAVLAGMLIPAVGLVRTAAWGSKCTSNQRQIFHATQGYATDNDGLLPNGDVHATLGNWSWTLRIGVVLYPDVPESAIRTVVYQTKSTLTCPAAFQAHADEASPTNVSGYSSYGVNWYVDTGVLRTFASLAKSSQVMLHVDSGWSSASKYWPGTAEHSNPGMIPESPHNGSTIVTYADGHVEKSLRANLPLTSAVSTAGKPWWKAQ